MRRALVPLLLVLTLAAQTTDAQTDPVATLRAAAEQGDMAAQLDLAERLESGDGLLQNYARAAEWYARAAGEGSLDAANRLGRLYHSGLGVPRDLPRALDLLERAAAGGQADHLHDLALVLESTAPDDETLSRAADLYRQAADLGHEDAAVSLGVLLQNGTGVPQDFTEAAALYRRAAERGHPRALNNLGLLYVRGDGLQQDYSRAAELFKAAADLGLSEAMTNLGVLYENGFGVAQSDEIAADYYRLGGQGAPAEARAVRAVYDPRLAPPHGDAEALEALERSALSGDPVAEFQLGWLLLTAEPADPRRAIRAAFLLNRAAEAGHGPAMANLALMYFHGTGVPQDYVLGQMWLVLSASAGYAGAAQLSAIWTVRMTADQINDAQARAEVVWATLRRKSGPARP